MPDQEDEVKTYYVSSLRVRRELIPATDANGVKGYRCVTHAANGPEANDQVATDQVAFENILIDLKLMKPRGIAKGLFARAWRGLSMDQFGTKTPGSAPTEMFLPLV